MAEDTYSNKQVARLLRNIAAAYTLIGDPTSKDGKVSRFRIIAYEKAADAIEHLSREIRDIWQEGKLYKVPGIGPGIGSALEEFFEKGESSHFNQVLKGIPPSVFKLMDVPGIGPKKAFRLMMQFGITDEETVIGDLRNIAKTGQIAELEGFGQKSQDDIIEALDVYERRDRREERMPLPYAFEVSEEISKHLAELKEVQQIDLLGSLRRRVSTIGDIDISVMAEIDDSKKIVDHFLKYPGKRSIEGAGDRKASILAAGNVRMDLRVQEKESYGSMLQYFTGSKAHNIRLREYALKKGYSLSEYGLKAARGTKLEAKGEGVTKSKHPDGEEILTFETEQSLYEFLGLQYIPPEMREDTGEIEQAKSKQLPSIIELDDIKGDFHIHGSYDLKPSHDLGINGYDELVEKGVSLGYSYIGFADHNPKQSGLSSEEISTIMKDRKEHIDQILSSSKIPYFIGLEVDILPSGEIALPEKAFEYVDYLIVSVHSSFRMPTEEMTARVLKALSYPKVRIFGHPTGRLLGSREGIDVNWDQVFRHVVEHDIALEINAGPSRLDLPDTLVREAQEMGAKFIIDTDAHAASNMDWMKYGVYVARRGWLSPTRVVNTWPYEKFKKWIMS
ncbi:hypothetical protein IPM65_04235 [Candidatus Roizmanbacteria bacterium]|nr:MAG: hypothetical protein IPM65_04235 [Candidatus Roizmanbacteria bacterium]